MPMHEIRLPHIWGEGTTTCKARQQAFWSLGAEFDYPISSPLWGTRGNDLLALEQEFYLYLFSTQNLL